MGAEEPPDHGMILGPDEPPTDWSGLEGDPPPDEPALESIGLQGPSLELEVPPYEPSLESKPLPDGLILGSESPPEGQLSEQAEPIASGSRSEEFPVLRNQLLSGSENASAMTREAEGMDVDEEEEEESIYVFSGIGGESIECDSEELSANQWSCRCEYMCLECGKMFYGTSELGVHIRDSHCMNSTTYKEKHGLVKLMTKEVRFSCHLCGANMQWRRVTLEGHAKSQHHMSLQQFHQTSLERLNLTTHVNEGQVIEASGGVHETVAPCFEPPLHSTANTNESADTNEQSANQWSNQCEYKCLVCGKMFYNTSAQIQHIWDRHGMNSNVFKEKHGLERMMTKEVKFKCHLCDMSMQWMGTTLSYHAKHLHGMSLHQFHQSSVNFVNDGEAVEHHDVEPPTTNKNDTEGVPNDNDVPRYEGKTWLTVKEWMNQCEFKCLECGLVLREERLLLQHLSRHGLDADKYEAKHGLTTLMTKEVRTKCFICNAEVQSVRETLLDHARSHSIPLFQLYEAEFGPVPSSRTSNKAGTISSESQPIFQSQASENIHFGESGGGENIVADGGNNVNQGKPYLRFSEWINQCQYKCLECGSMFRVNFNLGSHLKSRHGLDTAPYKAKYGLSSLMTKEVRTRCVICNVEFQSLRQTTKRHAGSHNMTTQQLYEKEFNLLPKTSGSVQVVANFAAEARSEQLPPENFSDFINWYSQCEYTCRECNKSFSQSTLLVDHIIVTHGMTKESYLDKYKTTLLMTKRVMLKCAICGWNVSLTYSSLLNHAKTNHNMTLLDFYQMHKNSSTLVRDVKIELVSHQISSDPVAQSGAAGNVDTVTSTSNRHEEATEEMDVVRDIQPQEYYSPLKTGFDGYTKWHSQCEYACRVCNKVFCRDGQLLLHVSEVHHMNKDSYLEKYNVVSLMTRKVMLPCPICGKKITQTYFTMRKHAIAAHSIGLKEMFHTYVVASSNVSGIPAQDKQNQILPFSTDQIDASTRNQEVVEDLEFVKWYSGCEYKCLQCEAIHWSYLDILRHLDTTHAMTIEEYKAQNGLTNIMTKATHKPCSLCGVSGIQFNRKNSDLRFGLKIGLRFHFDSVTCLNYPILNFFLV